MKIIYTGAFRFPAQDAAAARVLSNAKAIRSLGHEVAIISWGGKARNEDNVEGRFNYEGFDYHVTNELTDGQRSLRTKILGVLNRGNKTLELLKDMENVDAVIAYNPPLGFTRKCQSYCAAKHIRFITDLTEWYASNEFPGGKLSPLYWMSELNMRWMQKKVKNKIVISSFLNSYFQQGNNLLVPPLVDLQENKWIKDLSVVPEDIRKHHGIKLLFAGNPAKKDLLANILQAVLYFEGEIQMMVLGVGKVMAAQYIDMKKWKQYPESVVFLGRVPQEDVPSYYHLADFSVIVREPNRKNMAGFPTKMAESYAAGCPVMLNATSDLMEYVNDGRNCIVLKDYSVNSIIEGMHRLLKLSQEDIKMFKYEARKTGKDYFDYSLRKASFDYFFLKLQ